MKVGMVVYGSNGDIEPMVSLALELIKRKHTVQLFIISIHDRDYTGLHRYQGLAVYQKPYGAQVRAAADDDLEYWNKPLSEQFLLMDRWYKGCLEDLVKYSYKFAQECEVLVGPQHLLETSCIAEKFNIPYVSLRALPAHVRSSAVPPYWLSFFNIQGMTNDQMWDLLESHENKSYKRYINRFRRAHELPPVKNVLTEVINSRWLNLISYSKHLYKKPNDWNTSFHLCGHFKSPIYLDWNPSIALRSFLLSGEKPIFMSFYSMLEYENDKEKFQATLLSVAEQLNRRVVIHSNWINESLYAEKIYQLNGIISFDQIIPHCSVSVHHGGVGISHISTACGAPSVVVKYGCDHPFNADALFDAGVSAGSIFRSELRVESLVSLIRQALDNQSLHERATNLAALMAEENGASKAASILEQEFLALGTLA